MHLGSEVHLLASVEGHWQETDGPVTVIPVGIALVISETNTFLPSFSQPLASSLLKSFLQQCNGIKDKCVCFRRAAIFEGCFIKMLKDVGMVVPKTKETRL